MLFLRSTHALTVAKEASSSYEISELVVRWLLQSTHALTAANEASSANEIPANA